MRLAGLVFLAACGGAPETKGTTVELPSPTLAARAGRPSPIVEAIAKGIGVADIDLRGTAYAPDEKVLLAIRKEAEIDLPAFVLDAVGLSREAAERRAGTIRPACAYGDPKARTSTSGLGATVDERYETSVALVIGARAAVELAARALKIDEPASARRHPSFGSWESSVVSPLASMSLGLVEITSERRKPELASAWRAEWKDIVAMPRTASPAPGEPSGWSFAADVLGYFGRLVPQAEYDAAGKQLPAMEKKEPDAHAVLFRVVDLAVRDVFSAMLDQAELPDDAKDLRALGPIRSMSDLAAAREHVVRAARAMEVVSRRVHALCDVVQPMLAEQDMDAPPRDVVTYGIVFSAARELKTPKLDEQSRAFLEKLVRMSRGDP